MPATRLTREDCDCAVRSEAICGESPMWSMGEQVLYWTDNVGRRVHRFDPSSGRGEALAVGENLMDIGLRDGGGLGRGAREEARVLRPRLRGDGRVREVEQDRPDNRFNDGKVDRRGRYWAGGMDAQPLWASRLVSRSAITAPSTTSRIPTVCCRALCRALAWPRGQASALADELRARLEGQPQLDPPPAP